MNFLENIKEAIVSIRSNFLRSLLTLLIVAVGITCLVGILTAIDAVLFSMSDNFNRLGANAIQIRPSSETIQSNRDGRQEKQAPPITIDEALAFKDKYRYRGAIASVESWCSNSATVKYGEKETNPNIQIRGIDENYLITSSFDLSFGRNFKSTETNKAILGSEISKLLFDGQGDKAIGKQISVNSDRYTVIGVLEEKGSGSGSNTDKRVYIPLNVSKYKYGYENKNYNVSLAVNNAAMVDDAIENSIGIMRNIRKLKPGDENDFEIRKSDSILQTLKDMTSKLRWSTIVIAMLTLLGAAIGLMNIMLVSVTERTREIGIRKALGATSDNVLIQFLTEAIIICLMGGAVGIVFGIIIGIIITILIDGIFVIPWLWILLGIVICVFVGIISGLYPALKASKLDPIEALRYE